MGIVVLALLHGCGLQSQPRFTACPSGNSVYAYIGSAYLDGRALASSAHHVNKCDYRHLRMTKQIQHIVPFTRKRLCHSEPLTPLP